MPVGRHDYPLLWSSCNWRVSTPLEFMAGLRYHCRLVLSMPSLSMCSHQFVSSLALAAADQFADAGNALPGQWSCCPRSSFM